VIDVRQLRYFVAVAEELNFRRAAERVFLTQPSLSQQIQKLETQLGVRLLERDQHHVELTEAGRIMLRDSKMVIAELERAIRNVRRVSALQSERISLGLPEALIADLLPLIEQFRRQHPEVPVELLELDTPAQVEGLHTGQIDVALVSLTVAEDKFERHPIGRIPFVVAVSERHALTTRLSVSLSDLRNQEFVLLPRKALPQLHDYLMGCFEHAGFRPKVAREANRFQQVMSLVSSDVGINLCPATYRKLHPSGVVFVDLEPPVPELEVVALWRKDDAPTMLAALLEALRFV
jgi:LysR family transcriptional regulator, benzoate and cis,cis-muconate-responsive activator of ben and cat genes